MSGAPNREPGIYGGDERLLTEEQLRDAALYVKSIESIWSRFSKITAQDRVEESLVREVSQAIIDYLKRKKLIMSGMESVEVFRILRKFAENEQKKTG